MEAAIVGVKVIGGWIAANIVPIAVGAAIGAAIGGISAAITGGSIGKGILFGAIGGAVTAGAGAYLSGLQGGGGAVGGTAGGSSSGAIQGGRMAFHVADSGRNVGQSMGVGAVSAGSGAGGGAAGGWMTGMGQAFVQGGLSALGGMMEGKAMEEENMAAREFAAEQAREQHERDKEILAMNLAGGAGGGGGGGSSDALEATKLQLEVEREKMADARNQWNQSREDALAKVSTQRSALAGLRASRGSDEQVSEGTPGIDRQGNEDIAGLFGDPQQQVEKDPLAAPDPLMTEEEEKIYG